MRGMTHTVFITPIFMNIALWIAQGLLALAFAAAGFVKTTGSELSLSKKMPWTNDFSMRQIKTIGTLEMLGAFGVIVPRVTGILPILTPMAATGLACVMVGAAFTHIRREEYFMLSINVPLFMLAAFVAYGRFAGY